MLVPTVITLNVWQTSRQTKSSSSDAVPLIIPPPKFWGEIIDFLKRKQEFWNIFTSRIVSVHPPSTSSHQHHLPVLPVRCFGCYSLALIQFFYSFSFFRRTAGQSTCNTLLVIHLSCFGREEWVTWRINKWSSRLHQDTHRHPHDDEDHEGSCVDLCMNLLDEDLMEERSKRILGVFQPI